MDNLAQPNARETAHLFEGQVIYDLPNTVGGALEPFPAKLNGKTTAIVYKGHLAEHETLLNNIVAAVNKEAATTVAIIQLDELAAPALANLLQADALRFVWFFGVVPSDVSLQIKVAKYQVFNFLKLRVLFADELDKVQQNKRELWTALKIMYGIK